MAKCLFTDHGLGELLDVRDLVIREYMVEGEQLGVPMMPLHLGGH